MSESTGHESAGHESAGAHSAPQERQPDSAREEQMHSICGNLERHSAGERRYHLAFDPVPRGHDSEGRDLTSTSIGTRKDKLRNNMRPRRSVATVDIAAAIVHEISQPLTAIVANAQAARRQLNAEHVDLEALRTAVQSILRDSIDVSQTTRNINALFRNAGADAAPVDLPCVIREVLLGLDSKLQQHAVDTHLYIDAGVRPVAGNGLQLRQLLKNLMTNAIESMEENCERPRDLEINVSREGRTVLTEISDLGHGATDCEKIFDPFFSTKKEGMGMGLHICRTIIEAHKGRIWASARCDRGTVLAFTLPLAGELA